MVRCVGITAAGKRCKRTVAPGQTKCHQHVRQEIEERPWGPRGWINPETFYDPDKTQPTQDAFCDRCPQGVTPADCAHLLDEYAKEVDVARYNKIPMAQRRQPCVSINPQPHVTREAERFCKIWCAPGSSVQGCADWHGIMTDMMSEQTKTSTC